MRYHHRHPEEKQQAFPRAEAPNEATAHVLFPQGSGQTRPWLQPLAGEGTSWTGWGETFLAYSHNAPANHLLWFLEASPPTAQVFWMSDGAEICGPVFLCRSRTGVYIWYSDVFLFSLGKGKKGGGRSMWMLIPEDHWVHFNNAEFRNGLMQHCKRIWKCKNCGHLQQHLRSNK